jgi:hypothetical protein
MLQRLSRSLPPSGRIIPDDTAEAVERHDGALFSLAGIFGPTLQKTRVLHQCGYSKGTEGTADQYGSRGGLVGSLSVGFAEHWKYLSEHTSLSIKCECTYGMCAAPHGTTTDLCGNRCRADLTDQCAINGTCNRWRPRATAARLCQAMRERWPVLPQCALTGSPPVGGAVAGAEKATVRWEQ